MAYRLHDLDRAGDAVRRVAHERLGHASTALVEGDGDADAVHTARKDLKKTRSLLRLARPGMPKQAYRARNDELREVARSLESAREAEALAGAVEALAAHAGGRLMPEAFADLAASLRRSAGASDAAPADATDAPADVTDAPAATGAAADAINAPAATGAAADATDAADAGAATERATHAGEVADRLAKLGGAVEEWPLDDLTAADLVDGFARAYERGRDELRAARKHPTSVVLHEWRKRVKDLWYHARLLRVGAPGALQPIVDDADVLADVLGDEHDLAVLLDRLDAGDPSVAGIVVDEDALRTLVADRRTALRDEAGTLAARLYAEKPKAFARRMHATVTPSPIAFPLPRDVR